MTDTFLFYSLRFFSIPTAYLLRHLFEAPSTSLRQRFDRSPPICRSAVEEHWENSRRTIGAGIYQIMRRYPVKQTKARIVLEQQFRPR
ncbi:hypothetical protein SAMN05661044_02020 [Olivibacter domesticus]|uniref:Uncharacterized protein n=1 Tax=Olivibacter domesticus TaxID=407022 RepID=A0A1H7MJX1_OLID1|nr:hypothetical protein SAMN05661044_02020 [Olivibacter domesticus]